MRSRDHEEIAKHEGVGSIDPIEAAAKHAAPAIEAPARAQAAAPHLVGLHGGGPEWNAVVAIALVDPPALVQEPPFPLQPGKQRRTGKRREMIEDRQIK